MAEKVPDIAVESWLGWNQFLFVLPYRLLSEQVRRDRTRDSTFRCPC